MYETLKSLFELLFQGTIAGLIVVAVTEILNERKDKHLCDHWCKLLVVEISCHIEQINAFLSIGTTFPTSRPFIPLMDTWNSGKPYFTVLPHSLLIDIANYYVGLENVAQMIRKSTIEEPPLHWEEHLRFLLKSAEALREELDAH